MTRILIADDHAVVREGLKQLLADDFPQTEFFDSATIPETLELIRKERFDLLLLDLFMPGGSGFIVLKEVKQDYPTLPVLVLSSAPVEQLGLRALRAGACGYLDKQAAPEQLVQAVRQVLGGGRYLSPTLAGLLATEDSHSDQPLHENLSKRETQVLQLVVKGQSLKEIAEALSLSVKTIRTFHGRILRKLQVESDVDLVHYALAQGLIEIYKAPQPSPN